MGNLSGKFLKDGHDILARPISQLYNVSIKLNSFPRSCKSAKVKPLFKKGSKTGPENYRPIWLLSHLFKYYWKDYSRVFWVKAKFSSDFNLVFKKTIPLTLVSDI